MMELVSELAVVFDRLVKRLESRAGTDPVTESQKPDDVSGLWSVYYEN